MLTLPLLSGYVALEVAAGLAVTLACIDPGRRARRALALLAAVALLGALALLALGALRVGEEAIAVLQPAWPALGGRVLLAFAGTLALAACLAFVGPPGVVRAALVLAALLGLAALAVLDAIYGGGLVAGAVLAPLAGTVALGGLVAALTLTARANLLGRAVGPSAQTLLSLGVGALALQGFVLLGHVALGLPGPSVRTLLHGSLGLWFWLRLGVGLALPLVLGLVAQRVDARRPALLAWLLAAMVGLLMLGELMSRLLLVQTAVLF